MVIGKKELNIQTTPTRTTKGAWLMSGIVVLALVMAVWWLMKPNQTASSGSGGVLAVAPATPPQPLNADGAPRSD